jgi:hypothetical protein
MTIVIANRIITKIAIIDDQADVRESYEPSVEDLGAESVSEAGPLEPLPDCVKSVRNKTDAAICDYNLRVKAYSTFNGAELAAEFYRASFPAVLCTKWHKAVIDEMRQYRRYIPAMIDPSSLSPSSIRTGIESCVHEFEGEFAPIRRPWRTLVRVEGVQMNEIGNMYVYVVVPAWNSNEVIKLPFNIIPKGFDISVGCRFHANVNIGATGNEELYFEQWEA